MLSLWRKRLLSAADTSIELEPSDLDYDDETGFVDGFHGHTLVDDRLRVRCDYDTAHSLLSNRNEMLLIAAVLTLMGIGVFLQPSSLV